MKFIECYDVGGTNIRGALIDYDSKKIVASELRKTMIGNPVKVLEQIRDVSISLRNKILSSKGNILAVSLVFPGPVKNGVLIEAPNMGIKSSLDVVSKLKKDIKEPIYVENDMKGAVKAELQFGVGKIAKNFYLLTISTGIGVGIVLDGKAVHGTGGEFGHDTLEGDHKKANLCGCGRKGCWEAMASGHGIDIMIKNSLKSGATVKELFEMHKRGDKKAEGIIDAVRDYNAHGIGNMVNALQVDMIVVMGSVGLNQYKIVIPSEKEIKKYTINDVPKMQPTKLGSNIGIFGAYVMACENLRK